LNSEQSCRHEAPEYGSSSGDSARFLQDLKELAFQAGWSIKTTMSTKEILLDVAGKLPPDATLVDAIYELEFRQAVQEGVASLERGERVPLAEARNRLPQWISRYSSPTKP
jgi:hypothetical protein